MNSATMEKSTEIPEGYTVEYVPSFRRIGEITQQQVSPLLSPVPTPGSGARAASSVRGSAKCVRSTFNGFESGALNECQRLHGNFLQQLYQRGTSSVGDRRFLISATETDIAICSVR